MDKFLIFYYLILTSTSDIILPIFLVFFSDAGTSSDPEEIGDGNISDRLIVPPSTPDIKNVQNENQDPSPNTHVRRKLHIPRTRQTCRVKTNMPNRKIAPVNELIRSKLELSKT